MDPRLFASPGRDKIWRALRTYEPIYWHQKAARAGFWLITRHADVVNISRNTEIFVSRYGIGFPEACDAIDSPSARLQKKPSRGVLNLLDPPDHASIRRLLGNSLAARAVARLEPFVHAATIRLVEEIAKKGSVDFVSTLSAPLPLIVLSELMGVPKRDRAWIASLTAMRTPRYGTTSDEFQLALAELLRYFGNLIRQRRENPRDDLISELLTTVKSEDFTDSELAWFCLLLTDAGHETIRDALSGGLVALLEFPDERHKLIESPSLLESAVEEILRWTSPVTFFGRLIVHDVRLGSQLLCAGQRVIMVYPSANSDEHIFEQPERFDISRAPNPHLAFGSGRHFCLGAALARLQLRTVLPLVLERLPKLKLAGAPTWLGSCFSRGYSHVPISV